MTNPEKNQADSIDFDPNADYLKEVTEGGRDTTPAKETVDPLFEEQVVATVAEAKNSQPDPIIETEIERVRGELGIPNNLESSKGGESLAERLEKRRGSLSDGAVLQREAGYSYKYKAGQEVNVLRSDGTVDSDWKIRVFLGDGLMEVVNEEKGVAKTVSEKDLDAWKTMSPTIVDGARGEFGSVVSQEVERTKDMNIESLPTKSQEQLAQEYLSGYAGYQKILERTMNELRILDKLRDEVAPQRMIEEQERSLRAVHEEQKKAMRKYMAIGNRLTPETKDKYLKTNPS